MKKILGMTAFLLLNACTTEYILMDENANPVESGYYTENTEGTSGVEIWNWLNILRPTMFLLSAKGLIL